MNINDVIKALKEYDGEKITLMEVCGTHTASISENAIPSIISDKIHLISGPGCPVCVTVSDYVDKLIELALEGNVIVTFGDMIRVPGREKALKDIKADGADIRMVYSPMETIELAKAEPNKNFVFAAVGFETTTPIYALIKLRKQGKVINLYKSAVTSERNEKAYEIVHKYFEEYDAPWRGLGIIKGSGMVLKNEFAKYDAGSRELTNDYSHQKGCLCGEIISGNKKPTDCPLYNKICTPENPKGACMVSIEGTCYNYITNNRK